MANVTVFSMVVAELAGGLSKLFPSDFYFKDMLTKICNDAGVCIHFENTVGGVCYKLQGLWSAMQQAHKELTAAVDLHGIQPLMDTTKVQVSTLYSDETSDTRPTQKQSSTWVYNQNQQVRSVLSKPCCESEDGKAGKTPCSDDSGNRAYQYQSSLVPCIDNPGTKLRQRSLRSHIGSWPIQKPSKQENSAVSKVEQLKSNKKSKRVSCKKKQVANKSSAGMADICREDNSKSGSHDATTNLNFLESSKHCDNHPYAETKDISTSKEITILQNPQHSPCDTVFKMNMLETSQEVNQNETSLTRPRKTERKGRSRKSIPRQLSVASHRYPFFSKHNSRRYTSKHASIRNGRTAAPVANSSVALKQRLPEKCERKNCVNFSCPDCTFVTMSRSKLMDHIHGQHKGSPVCCDLCGKIFYSKTNMLRHRVSHRGPQHCCDVCGKMFKIQKAMINHRKTHDEGYTKPVFPCKLCEKAFCSQYIVDCHIRSFHLGQRKSYLCSFCGKKFTTNHSLQEHANAHTGNKPHICEICGKGFSYESALRDHKFTHDDVKQFSCEVCDKSFCQRSGLKMHMRIHRDVKQFQCQECGREFTQKQALQRHERVHKGVKPFTCRLCSRSFSDASVIRRHLTLVHKIHKDAKNWREDIICTIQPDLDFHVSLVGMREPDLQPNSYEENKPHTETRRPSPTRTQTGKFSKKKSLSQIETNSINNAQGPIQPASESNGTHEGDFLSIPSSYNNDLSLTGKIYPQDTTASEPVDKNTLCSLEVLPQGHDSASFHIQSQYPDLSIGSVNVVHSHSHNPLMTAPCDCQHRCSFSAVCCATVEEGTALPSMKKSVDSAIHTTLQSPLIQSNTVGESCPPRYPHGAQNPSPSSKESCTMAIVSATTSTVTPTGFNTTVTAQQTWSSLYYYTQLASQFGMTLSDYPYGAGSSHAGIGSRPSSPVLEQPSCCPRPQTYSLGGDHSSVLPRPQVPGWPNSDFLQRHGCRDVREMLNEGHGLMLSSPDVESSKSDL